MRQEIAGPLNIRFHLLQPDEEAAERPQGYYLNPIGERKEVSAVDEEARPGPDGGEYMTVMDLYRLQQALLDGSLYSRKTLDLSSEPMTDFASLNCAVGLVWELCTDGDRHFRTKGGTTTGGGSSIADWEEGGEHYSLVMLANYHNAPLRHYQGIAALLMNPAQPVPEGHPLKWLWDSVQDGSWQKVAAAPQQWFNGRGSLNGVTSLPLLALYAQKQGYTEAAAGLLKMNLWRYPTHELTERLLERIQPSGN